VLFSLSLDESSSPFLTILSPEEPSELSFDVAEDSGLMDLLIAVAGMAALLLGEITLCTLTSIGLLSSTKLDGLDALEPKKILVRTTVIEYSKHNLVSFSF
jgi:phosphoribosylcarboxyaminoimidazole (NCAIR) mutase